MIEATFTDWRYDAEAKQMVRVEVPIKDLEGRIAKCYCDRDEPSRPDLVFFAYHPNAQFDSYYCGCRGWD